MDSNNSVEYFQKADSNESQFKKSVSAHKKLKGERR